jgi:hypothetical protein
MRKLSREPQPRWDNQCRVVQGPTPKANPDLQLSKTLLLTKKLEKMDFKKNKKLQKRSFSDFY